MSKGVTQNQWLNIVIIIISALVLAFTLIGRFMDKTANESDTRQIAAVNDSLKMSVPSMQLTSIDFGTMRISRKRQKNQSTLAFAWFAKPKSSLNQTQINRLVDGWQKILTMPAESLSQPAPINFLPIATVLLYFAETAQPIITKVEVSNKVELTPSINIRFVSTGQQIIIEDLPLAQLLPVQWLQKSASDNDPSNIADHED